MFLQMRKYSISVFLWVLVFMACPCFGENWLQWGGPRGDFSVDARGLAESWPDGGPKRLWQRPLGDGYSSILVQGNRLYTAYLDGEHEVVIALDAKTGTTVWKYRFPRGLWEDMSPQFGLGPNATPLIVGDRILSISVDGQVHCLELATGKLQWKRDLPKEFGRRKRTEEYGYSASPLAYNDVAIVQVGGVQHAVVAFDTKDGRIVWKSEPGGVSYAQATITRLAGRDQYIYFSPEGLVALDPATGGPLWKFGIEYNNGNHLTPVVRCDENHLWVASQFTSGGGRLLEVARRGEVITAKEKWFDPKLQASHWTLIRRGDFIYGSSGGNRVSFLTAFNWKTGEVVWKERGFHKAQALYADEKLLFLDEDGRLAIANITPKELKILDSAQVTQTISWALPTLVGTTLYLRDKKDILALDLSKRP